MGTARWTTIYFKDDLSAGEHLPVSQTPDASCLITLRATSCQGACMVLCLEQGWLCSSVIIGFCALLYLVLSVHRLRLLLLDFGRLC